MIYKSNFGEQIQRFTCKNIPLCTSLMWYILKYPIFFDVQERPVSEKQGPTLCWWLPLHQTLHLTFYSRNTLCFRFFTLSKYGHDCSIIPFHLKHLHSRLSQEVRENTYPKLQRKPGSQIKIWSNTFHQYFSPRLRTNPLVRLKQFAPRETRLCATGKKQEETKQYK